jgi:tRNA threonylcarbamoyladenosine biosynthesis protein TsaE
MIFESFSENDTADFAKGLGEAARVGDIYCLCGGLGCGKTVFAKGFAVGLGVKGVVTSPTFTVMNRYEGRLPFYHFDVYRIKSVGEMADIGYEDYFFGDGVCLVEWADMIKEIIPSGVWVYITDGLNGSDCRKIEVRDVDTCY